jgi:hypothetical protein
MKLTRLLLQRCNCFSPLMALPAALLLIQGQAKAILTYNIFESGGNVVVQTSGSLDLTGASASPSFFCNDGQIDSGFALVCTGPPSASIQTYLITGPAAFDGTVSISPASNVSGTLTSLAGLFQLFAIDSAYISNDPIVSSATFNTTTLAGLGFTPGLSGPIGTWFLTGTSESIQVILGAPAAAVPGPLPLFGAAAAFGWSRKLRKRIATPLSTPPQA